MVPGCRGAEGRRGNVVSGCEDVLVGCRYAVTRTALPSKSDLDDRNQRNIVRLEGDVAAGAGRFTERQ